MAAEPLTSPSTAESPWTSPPATSPSAGARRADRQGRVVQSIAHKVTRPCSRNGCPAPARASMALDYAGKQVTLVPLMAEHDPRFLEVCPTHAEGLDVPRGWDLVDERGEEAPTPTGPPTAQEMASSSTVAVLAAALRGTPEVDIPAPHADDVVELVPRDERAVARTFDLPVNDFDPDVPAEAEATAAPAADPATPSAPPPSPEVVTPRPPSGRTVEPRRRTAAGDDVDDAADRRQLPLSSSAGRATGADAPRRTPRPVPAAGSDDRNPPEPA